MQLPCLIGNILISGIPDLPFQNSPVFVGLDEGTVNEVCSIPSTRHNGYGTSLLREERRGVNGFMVELVLAPQTVEYISETTLL